MKCLNLAIVAALLFASELRAGNPTEFAAGRMVVATYTNVNQYRVEIPAAIQLGTSFTVPSGPRHIAFGPDGHYYRGVPGGIAEYGATGDDLGTIAVPGLVDPREIAIGNGGDLVVADVGGANALVIVSLLTKSLRLSAMPGAHLQRFAIGANGKIFGALWDSPTKIVEIDMLGNVVRVLKTMAANELVMAMAAGPFGQMFLAVQTATGSRIDRIDGNGFVLDSTSLPTSEAFYIWSIAFGPNGDLFVGVNNDAQQTTGRVLEYLNSNGTLFNVGSSSLGTNVIAHDIAFVPYRFTVDVSGSLYGDGVTKKGIKESLALAVSPASGAVLVDFKEGGILNDMFQIAGLGCHGLESFEDGGSKKRLYSGIQIGKPSEATGDLAIEVSGKFDSTNRMFRPSKLGGTLVISGAAGAFKATLSNSKLLNKEP